MQDTQQHGAVDVFIGVDVGKGQHHAVALDRNGKRLYNKALPNDEVKLRALITELKTHGRLLFVVDQPSTIGALPVAVARAEGVLVAYLPGLAMRRIADLHAGEAKTDARDAAIIAEAARSMPHTLRSLRLADEQLAELTMLCGFDDDLGINASGSPSVCIQAGPRHVEYRADQLDRFACANLINYFVRSMPSDIKSAVAFFKMAFSRSRRSIRASSS